MADRSRHNSAVSHEAAETRLGWRMAGLAFTLSSEVAAGALLGWLVDWMFGTKPKGLIIGAIVGIAVGLLTFIRGALSLNRLLTAQEKLRPPRPRPPQATKTSADPDDAGKEDGNWSNDD